MNFRITRLDESPAVLVDEGLLERFAQWLVEMAGQRGECIRQALEIAVAQPAVGPGAGFEFVARLRPGPDELPPMPMWMRCSTSPSAPWWIAPTSMPIRSISAMAYAAA